MPLAMKSDAKVDLLKSIPLFSGCNRKELRQLAALTMPLAVGDGEILCREGVPGSEFFVLVSGHAVVSEGGVETGHLGPGDVCGEMALLDGGPRIATVTATTPGTVLVLSRGEFDDLLDVAPGIGLELLRSMSRRLRAGDHATVASRQSPIGI